MTPLNAPATYVRGLWQDILSRIKSGIEGCWSKTEDIRLVNGQRLSLLSPGKTEVFITVSDGSAILTPVGVLPVTVDGGATLALAAPGLAVFTGTTATWTLPAVANSIGWLLLIKNRGSGDLTVQRAGSDQIYRAGAVNSITVSAGITTWLTNDGTYWDAELVRGAFG